MDPICLSSMDLYLHRHRGAECTKAVDGFTFLGTRKQTGGSSHPVRWVVVARSFARHFALTRGRVFWTYNKVHATTMDFGLGLKCALFARFSALRFGDLSEPSVQWIFTGCFWRAGWRISRPCLRC